MLRRVESCWSSKWPVTRRRQYITPLSKCPLCVVVVFALEWTHSTIQQNAVLIEINFIAIPVKLKCPSLSCWMENSMLGKMGPLLYCSATAPPYIPQLSIAKTKVELCTAQHTAAWSRRHQNGVKQTWLVSSLFKHRSRRNVERAVLRKGSSHFLTFIRLLGQRR